MNTADRKKPKQLLANCDPDLYLAIKKKAAEQNTSIRAIIMRGLLAIGFDVPKEDLEDKRR